MEQAQALVVGKLDLLATAEQNAEVAFGLERTGIGRLAKPLKSLDLVFLQAFARHVEISHPSHGFRVSGFRSFADELETPRLVCFHTLTAKISTPELELRGRVAALGLSFELRNLLPRCGEGPGRRYCACHEGYPDDHW